MRIAFTGLVICLCLLFSAAVFSGIGTDKTAGYDESYNTPILRGERIPGQSLLADEIPDYCANQLYAGDTMKVLAILVEWSDRPGTYSAETFDTLLFSRGVLPEGSLAEYYDEVSFGKLTIVGNVEGWLNVGDEFAPWDSWKFDTVAAELDPFIDYSQYDANGDDTVDVILFIQAGNGASDTGDPDDARAVAWKRFGSWALGPFDGVMVNRLCKGAETQPIRNPDNLFEFTGENRLNDIWVYCHELTHTMNLPDLYDYDSRPSDNAFYTPDDYNDHPMVDWCMMDGGTHGNAFRPDMPIHLCGWSKMKLGWIEPVVLDGEYEDLVIHNIESYENNSLFMLPITPSEGEYFLLEYRDPFGSHLFGKTGLDMSKFFYPDLDFGEELLDRGLLITHVHDSLFVGFCLCSNDGFPDYPHYVVAVEDAGYDPERDYTYNPEGRVTDSAQWWYPYETRKGALFSSEIGGQSEFGPETTPGSDGYFGPSNIYVRVDSIVGDRLYAYINTDYSGSSYVCGDANGDGEVNQLDVAYLIDYLHKDGPPPEPMEAGDANGDGAVDKDDAKYLIEFLHKDGPPPVCP